MKTKFNVKLTVLLVLIGQLLFAQERTISGTVNDDAGLPLPGVNIIIEGTTTGTQSDFDGNYSIRANEGQTLVFSYVGFETQSVRVGTSNTVNVIMAAGTELEQVVVTALGVSREKQSLGYSTQEVAGEDISTVKSGNFTNALSGKVSGLQIRRNNNFAGSTNVVIRGNTSLTGDNQALFVVDGVPISNRNTNTAAQNQASGNYYDYGNAAADINPDDIESINVLKGAAASALYGSRAANGVIIITTKKGKKSKGMGVTLNSNSQFGFIDKSTFPTFQNEYGAGYDGEIFTYEDLDGDGIPDQMSNYIDDGSYGPAFNPNLYIYQWDAFDPASPNYMRKTPWVAAKNGPIKFFQTPLTFTNSIAISNGMEGGAYRISYTKHDQSGIMPNSQLDRHNFIFSGSYDVNERLKVSSLANYIKTDAVGRNSTGYNDNIIGMFRQWWQTNVDVLAQRDIYFKTRRNVSWNPKTSQPGSVPLYWDNPYWTRYENYQNDGRNRFIGNIELNYELTDWLSVMGRVSTDTYNEYQEERRAVGSVAAPFGVSRGNVDSGYARKEISSTETNYDLMFNVNTNFSEAVSFAGLLGANLRRNEYKSLHASTAGGLVIPGLYSLKNGENAPPNPVEVAQKIGVNGIFASASFGFGGLVYLDGTIRRDHSSTLARDNSVFYYPSVSTSFVFSKLLNTDAINFGKLRLNYAEVGNGAPFDRLYDTYSINNDIGTALPITKNNPNLKPERTKSYEAGLEMRFAQNRIGFDVAYYQSNSIDQIISVPISVATGYSNKLLNAGEIENRGIEATLNLVPVKTNDFQWNLTGNFTRNRNEVLSLPEGTNTIQLGRFQGGVSIQAALGEPYGVIYGTDFVYHANGERMVDPDTGRYLITPTSNNVIGDTNPDWMMGISNAFTYKDFTLGFLIDIQHGGNVWSLDQNYGESTGLYPNSAGLNDLGNPVRAPLDEGGGFINPGVLPNGSPNNVRVDASEFGEFGYAAMPNAAFIYDASYVKLRQASLTYTMPSRLLQNTFMTGIQITVTGSNLWIIDKKVPYADPEAGLSSGNLQGYLTGALPTTKEYGLNIQVQF